MEYISNIDDIQSHQLIFKMPVKNQNSKYLYYYKLLYSDTIMHLKYLLFQINFNPSFMIHPLKVNKKDPIFDKIKQLEYNILQSINQTIQKEIQLNIYDEIMQKEITYVVHNNPCFQPLFLKISGVWEDTKHIGLVYKLYYSMNTKSL